MATGAGMLSTPATAHNNWYVGAGAGWMKGTASTAVEVTNGPDSEHIRSQFSDTAPMGAIFAGHTSHATNYSWFIQGRGFWDNSVLKKTVQFDSLITGTNLATVKISRLGTLAFDGGISKSYNGFDMSLQLGILLSKFDVKFDDIINTFSKTGGQYVWGVAPGFKVERDLGFATLGVGYEYQIYAPLKYSCADMVQGREYSVNSKSRYHSVMATIKKSF
jgi:hypothetical protein